VQFTWDERKNRINIRRHGIDFYDVIEVFQHPLLTATDQREDYGETRWLGMGLMQARVVVVVYTERVNDEIRIISARKASRVEVRRFEQAIKN
jgi:uncharacterized DUF497 family protein